MERIMDTITDEGTRREPTMETFPPHIDRQHVRTVLERVRLPGGVPATEAYIGKLSTWFRTLGSRGWTTAEFMKRPDEVRATFREGFPNVATRRQFIMSFLKYLSGLTDEEYASEYPNMDRQKHVELLHSVTRNDQP